MSNNGGACTGTFIRQGSTNTCWFLGALNQFLLTRAGNRIFFNALVKYVNTELKSDTGRRDLLTPNATCPMYGKLHSKFNFYKLIYHYFQNTAQIVGDPRRVVQNIIPTRRGEPILANWGHAPGVIKSILDRLSIVNYNSRVINSSTNVITSTSHPDVPLPDFYLVTPNTSIWRPHSISASLFGSDFYLGAAYINLIIHPQHGGDKYHAICGIKCGGSYYIVDSNSPLLMPCDWRDVRNINTNGQLLSIYASGTSQINIIESSINDVIYWRKNLPVIQSTNLAQLRNSLRINTKTESFTQEIARAATKWEGYKMAFFNGDANGVLRASFLISYLLFKIEFSTIMNYPWRFDNLQQVKAAIPRLRDAVSSPNAAKQLGFNYKNGGNPAGFGRTASFYSAMMLLKNGAMNSLIKDGKWVDINTPEYEAAENNMIAMISSRTNLSGSGNFATAMRARNWKSIFKYTSYSPGSKLIESFFFHSMAMFGWWGFYGIRKSSSNTNVNPNSRGFIPTERPGSCNVAGLLNMYIWKKMGKLDDLIYIAHGRTQVATAGQINAITATRTSGVDDVQFCHHGWQLAGNRPNIYAGAATSNMPSMGGRWWQRTLYSHSDAFDVLTLAPIFRSIQRLRRQDREGRAQFVRMLVAALNTRIKDFLQNHLMSTLPRNIQNISGEMTSQNVLPRRMVRAPAPSPAPRPARVNNALRARVAAQSNAAAVRRRQALVPVNITTVRSPSANLNKWFKNHNLPPPNDIGFTRKNWLSDIIEYNPSPIIVSRARKLLQNLNQAAQRQAPARQAARRQAPARQAAQRQAPARQAAQRPSNLLNLAQFESNGANSVHNSAKKFIKTLKSKSYQQLPPGERVEKLKVWLGPLFKNNYTGMRNFASKLPYEKNINDTINSLRSEPINNNWKTNRSRIKRLLWSVAKRNSN